jgi:hypothetical protein
MPAVMRLQESRTVEISVYGLTRGVGLTTHSYSIVENLTPPYKPVKLIDGVVCLILPGTLGRTCEDFHVRPPDRMGTNAIGLQFHPKFGESEARCSQSQKSGRGLPQSKTLRELRGCS